MLLEMSGSTGTHDRHFKTSPFCEENLKYDTWSENTRSYTAFLGNDHGNLGVRIAKDRKWVGDNGPILKKALLHANLSS